MLCLHLSSTVVTAHRRDLQFLKHTDAATNLIVNPDAACRMPLNCSVCTWTKHAFYWLRTDRLLLLLILLMAAVFLLDVCSMRATYSPFPFSWILWLQGLCSYIACTDQKAWKGLWTWKEIQAIDSSNMGVLTQFIKEHATWAQARKVLKTHFSLTDTQEKTKFITYLVVPLFSFFIFVIESMFICEGGWNDRWWDHLIYKINTTRFT